MPAHEMFKTAFYSNVVTGGISVRNHPSCCCLWELLMCYIGISLAVE